MFFSLQKLQLTAHCFTPVLIFSSSKQSRGYLTVLNYDFPEYAPATVTLQHCSVSLAVWRMSEMSLEPELIW